MNPKEFYQSNLPESRPIKFVLGLFPEESAAFFEHEITPLIAGKDNVNFNSYLRVNHGINIISNILNDIQNASVIITDVSGFNPNVMYELGIALLKNDNNILIAKEENKDNLPIYLANLRINYYSIDGLSDFKNRISQCIDELMPELPHQCSFSPSVRDLVAEIKSHVSEKSYKIAHILCRELKEKDPQNFCVEELWADILTKNKDLDEAKEKYDQILLDNSIGRSFTADIHLKKANLFTLYNPKRINDALTSCSQAESFYDKNPILYQTWAYAYHLNKNHEQAFEKIEIARRLDKTNKEIILRNEFYNNWRIDNNYNVSLGSFLRQKIGGTKNPKPTTGNPQNTSSKTDQSTESNYNRFKRTVQLNTNLNSRIIEITDHGIKFETTATNYPVVSGFVHKTKIPQTEYKTFYQVGDPIRVQYTSNNDQYNSIRALNIQKIIRS